MPEIDGTLGTRGYKPEMDGTMGTRNGRHYGYQEWTALWVQGMDGTMGRRNGRLYGYKEWTALWIPEMSDTIGTRTLKHYYCVCTLNDYSRVNTFVLSAHSKDMPSLI